MPRQLNSKCFNRFLRIILHIGSSQLTVWVADNFVSPYKKSLTNAISALSAFSFFPLNPLAQ